jgi:hypothetical protein
MMKEDEKEEKKKEENILKDVCSLLKILYA